MRLLGLGRRGTGGDAWWSFAVGMLPSVMGSGDVDAVDTYGYS